MTILVRIKVLEWADKLTDYTTYMMQIYLINEWNLSSTSATGISNIWSGPTMILPIGFLFLVDTFLGNFLVLLLSSIAYSVGMGFLTLSTVRVLASSTQKASFYTGLALSAVGISGHSVSLKPFFDEQRTEAANDDSKKIYFQILGMFMVTVVRIIGVIALPYATSWSISFGIPAICTLVATLLFLSGLGSYVKSKPQGSSLTTVCRVFVASTCKISRPFPRDDAEEMYYKKDGDELQSFSHTCFLRSLEKAAIILPDKSKNNRWRLCSVKEVEDTKIVFRMVPILMTFIVCGIVSSTGETYFLQQADYMDRSLGQWGVPYTIFRLLTQCAKCLFNKSYTRLENCFNKYNCKKYGPAVGIAVAMVFSVLCCIASAIIEIQRLELIRRHGLPDGEDTVIPMSVFWLLFQMFLLAGQDSFLENSSDSFVNDQAPKSMINYLQHLSTGVSGLGFMGNLLLVDVVGKISEKGGRRNWFQDNLNQSRLDNYYWVLAALSSVNLLAYILIAYIYNYKEPNRQPEQEEENCDWLADLVKKRMENKPKVLVVLVRCLLSLSR